MRPLIGVFYPGLLALLLGVTVAALLGGAASGLLAGDGWAWPPARTVPAVLAEWIAHPGDPGSGWPPGPRPGPVWLTYLLALVAGLLEALLGAGFLAWRGSVRRRRWRKRSGLAQPDTLDERLGHRAVAQDVARLRPSLATQRHISADAAGARFGAHRGSSTALYATHEDSKLVVAPTRMGKTGRQAVSDILRAPGAVVATSTRFDLIELTAMHRARTGGVSVFDPEGRTAWPTKLRWSPIAGCEDYDVALRRAIAICAARPLTDTKSGGYFSGQAEGVMAALLHAAALNQVGVDELRLWSTTKSRRPADILDAHPQAAFGVAGELREILDSAASANDTSGGGAIYATLALLLRPLASPATRDACTPRPDEPLLDIDAFIRGSTDTLYLVSRGAKNSAAPIVNALMADILHRTDVLSQFPTAAQLAAPAHGDLRLDPPIRVVMDEAANVTPVEDLAQRLADSGGRGVQLYIYVQSRSQLRQRWGTEQATEIWDNAAVKLVLGGLANSRDLEEMSRLLARRTVEQTSVSSGLDRNQVTVSQNDHRRALEGNEIRELPDGAALLFYRNLPGAVIDVPGWWQTPDLAELAQHSRTETRRLLAAHGLRVPDDPADDDEAAAVGSPIAPSPAAPEP
jgi:type IV secretory pathway TraG/TraD family ATPase VirD4